MEYFTPWTTLAKKTNRKKSRVHKILENWRSAQRTPPKPTINLSTPLKGKQLVLFRKLHLSTHDSLEKRKTKLYPVMSQSGKNGTEFYKWNISVVVCTHYSITVNQTNAQSRYTRIHIYSNWFHDESIHKICCIFVMKHLIHIKKL